jgi:flagellar hook-associated protein FlgK
VSTFSGLNAATTSLWAQRRGLDVTGQNIANVNTEGYSRQRADMVAIGGSVIPAFYSKSSGIGAGVNADEVTRIRDAFLEGRGQSEHANSARLTVQNDTYTLVQQAFREPGDTGIQSLMSDMWSGFGDLAKAPGDGAARGQVIKRLESLVGGIQSSAAALESQWTQTRENLDVLVKDVNASAGTIAELNAAIMRAKQSGETANDLSDQRDLLVMKLADQVGATVRPGQYGSLDVVVGNMTLVAGSSASTFAVVGGTDSATAAGDPPRVVTAPGNFEVRVGGTAEGQLSALNGIIPSYRGALDALANELATTLNGVHTGTATAPGTPAYDLAGVAGTDLLGSSGGPITAATLKVLITDPSKIAASNLPGGVLDNGNAQELAALGSSATGVDAGYRKMIVELGVQSAVTERNLGIQQVVTTQVDAARDSVAGVNMDEEMTNMLSYQHAYSAAARLVTSIDEMLDQLINRTGRVGL